MTHTFLNEEIFLFKERMKKKGKTHKLTSDGEFDLSYWDWGGKKSLIFFI